jgi:tRNA pseudouridine13 synthase
MELYSTSFPPCEAKVKAFPEDFRVEEIVSLEGMVIEPSPDKYPVYRVESRFIDTMHMAERLSVTLRGRVSIGGLKDKRSISTQLVTPTSLHSRRPAEVVDDRFTARIIGYVSSPITRSAVLGNRFDLVLRDCCEDIAARIEAVLRAAEARTLPNFYGLQRFGVSCVGTHRIGRAIVTGRFSEAAQLLVAGAGTNDPVNRSIWDAVQEERFESAIKLLPPWRDVERKVAGELARDKRDWIRAIRAVPIRLRRLYVHAFQSYLFNRSLSAALTRREDIAEYRRGDNWASVSDGGLRITKTYGVKDIPTGSIIPMMQVVGYAFRDYGTRFDSCIKEVLQSEGINPGNFFVKDMQEVSSEGGFRRPHLAISEPSWDLDDGNVSLKFTLAKGQYATVLLREITKADIVKAGFA